MGPGDMLAQIGESQIGTRSDLWSGRASLYGYLMATSAGLESFGTRTSSGTDLHWVHTGFGVPSGLHVATPPVLLPELHSDAGPAYLLRFHNWCAAFVDWCVRELLIRPGHLTRLSLSQRPRTAGAADLLRWGARSGCHVMLTAPFAPVRGDIAVYTFHSPRSTQHHVGIVSEAPEKAKQLTTVEGNTTDQGHGNQGFLVTRRTRSKALLKGLVRLPAAKAG